MVLIENKEIRFSASGIQEIKTIPVGNWLVKLDEFKGEFFLEKIEDFTMPDRIYGDAKSLATRYLNTFKEVKGNLGVVLSGLKGTGKSLTAKQTCIDSNLPVLVLSSAYAGTEFNSFIASIKQECVVFVDEFEKLYKERESQEKLLSLLDGVFMGRKLFLFTSNETSQYSNYLLNRPGRIHYMKNYERIEDSILDDIVADNLDNQEHAQELKDIIGMIEEANIDMVFALIRECNMYKENPKTAVEYLNIKIAGNSVYNVHCVRHSDNLVFTNEGINGNILFRKTLEQWVYPTKETLEVLKSQFLADSSPDDWDEDNYDIYFDQNLIDFDIKRKGRITVLSNDEYTLTFTPQEKLKFVF